MLVIKYFETLFCTKELNIKNVFGNEQKNKVKQKKEYK